MIQDVWEGRPFSLCHQDDQHLLLRVFGRHARKVADSWVISRHVGHLQLAPGRTLRIGSPKATAVSLMAWASFADPEMRSLAQLCQLPELGASGDLGGALAWLFCRQLLQVCQRTGVLRQYQQQPLESTFVRGRIAFECLARRSTPLQRIPCIVPLRNLNTPLNQLFAAALQRIARDPSLRQATTRDFQACAPLFESVTPNVDPVLLTGRTALSRLEMPFMPVYILARWLLTGTALGQGDGRDGIGFLVNLESLFEKAVLRAFSEAGQAGRPQHPLRYQRVDLGRTGSFAVDLFLPGPPPLVVDAKFKSDVTAANLHQMVSYCLLSGARRAVLVFPAGNGIGQRRYRFTPDGGVIDVDTLELATDGSTLADWRAAGQALVERSMAPEDFAGTGEGRRGGG